MLFKLLIWFISMHTNFITILTGLDLAFSRETFFSFENFLIEKFSGPSRDFYLFIYLFIYLLNTHRSL